VSNANHKINSGQCYIIDPDDGMAADLLHVACGGESAPLQTFAVSKKVSAEGTLTISESGEHGSWDGVSASASTKFSFSAVKIRPVCWCVSNAIGMMTVPLIWRTDVADAGWHSGDLRDMESPDVPERIVHRPISGEADKGRHACDC
jgi:hypothetical protein